MNSKFQLTFGFDDRDDALYFLDRLSYHDLIDAKQQIEIGIANPTPAEFEVVKDSGLDYEEIDAPGPKV
jgi:hypothetical protein